MRSHPLLSLSFVLFACGPSEGENTPDSDAGADTDALADSDAGADADALADADADADAGTDVDTGEPPLGEPILERDGTLAYTCSETIAPVQTEPRDWFTLATFAIAGEPWVLRTTSFQTEISIAGVEITGAIENSQTVAEVDAGANRGAAWAEGLDVTLVWSEFDGQLGGQYLVSAVVNVTTGVTRAATPLSGNSPAIGGPVMAKSGDTLAVVWSETDDAGSKLLFAKLDADGIDGEPVTIATSSTAYQGLDPSLIALDDGFAVSWSRPTDENLAMFEVYFSKLDINGAKVGSQHRISPESKDGKSFGSPWNGSGASMLAVGDDVWVAFTESWQNGSFGGDAEGYVDILVAVVDPDTGAAELAPLNTRVNNINHLGASLYAFGDDVGITWVQGTAIYVCAGCYVDYDIHHVIVDPQTLTPKSADAVHTHNAHGYARARVIVADPVIRAISQQDFHALNYPVLSEMTCTLE